MLTTALRTTAARILEEGTLDGPWSRALAHVHAAIAERTLARPLHVPPDRFVVTVGGATLGGSGKTRVAIACARVLADAGHDVALIGHAYRARVQRACEVSAASRLDDVGDEALACARALLGSRVRVVVGPSRQRAVDHACALSPRVTALVVDGPLQLAPVRASLALLAVDADHPWGRGRVAPAGDLRARPEALVAQADVVVPVPARITTCLERGATVPLTSLTGARVGLFTALARPARILRALAAEGIVPVAVVRAPDHGPLTSSLAKRLAEARVDVWLATAKCALHLDDVKKRPGVRAALFVDELRLSPELRDRLEKGARAASPADGADARSGCPTCVP